MDVTESFLTSTTDMSEVSTASESMELFSTSTLLSTISELMTEASDTITEQSPKGSVSISDLRFSVVDYIVFGIMLAMSGEINYLN